MEPKKSESPELITKQPTLKKNPPEINIVEEFKSSVDT